MTNNELLRQIRVEVIELNKGECMCDASVGHECQPCRISFLLCRAAERLPDGEIQGPRLRRTDSIKID